MKKQSLLISLSFILLALVMHQCANQGSLGGGPKDEDPPVFLGSDPVKYSRNSTPKRVVMEFDEFLVLKDLNQNLIISPPLNEDPLIKLKGKRVLIKNHKKMVYDTNTTYTYYFGNAICDLHEDNPIENFEYVFSTGPSLDSLSIRGQVLNARFLTPEESVYVCLYKKQMNDTIVFDSLPYFVRPYYVSRTDKKGNYALNNIRMQEYMVFAIKDVNSNYYFDMPNEEIAFVDSLMWPQEVLEYIPDSIPIDTSNYHLMDSLWLNHSYTMVQNQLSLFMFSQDDSIPRLLESTVLEEKKIDFFFRFPVHDSVQIRLLNDSIPFDWYEKEYSKNRDTLSLWLTRINQDSLIIEMVIDTLAADTLDFLVRHPKQEKKKKRSRKGKKDKKDKQKKEGLKYSSNASTSLAFYKDIHLEFETPLKYANFDYILLKEDSVRVIPEIFFTDSIHRKITVSYDWLPDTKYEFILPQEALADIFGLENDSIILQFTTTKEDAYSRLILDFRNPDSSIVSPILLQIVNGGADKEVILQQHRVLKDTILVFEYLNEGDFLLKAIVDKNDNGQWNTGHFGDGLLPETVYYSQKWITTKANWDVKEAWHPTEKDKIRPPKKKEEKEKGKK